MEDTAKTHPEQSGVYLTQEEYEKLRADKKELSSNKFIQKLKSLSKKAWRKIIIITLLVIMALTAIITSLVLFAGLRGIYVDVENPNNFMIFTPGKYSSESQVGGVIFRENGKFDIQGSTIILTTETQLGKLTVDFSFVKLDGYKRIKIADKEFKRITVWRSKKVSVNWDLQGGNGNTPASGKVNVPYKFEKFDDPIRQNYQFMGWYDTPYWMDDDANSISSGTPVWENTTIYAGWKGQQYEVVLNGEVYYLYEGQLILSAFRKFLLNENLTLNYVDQAGTIKPVTEDMRMHKQNLEVYETYEAHFEIVNGDILSIKTEGLTHIEIPSSVTSIGNVFQSYTSLRSLHIPSSVSWVNDRAFRGNKFLKVYVEAETKPDNWHADWNRIDYNGDNDIRCIVYWGVRNTDIARLGDGVYIRQNDEAVLTTYVGSAAGFSVSSAVSILGEKYIVKSIGVAAFLHDSFNNTDILTSVTIPNTVESFSSYGMNLTIYTEAAPRPIGWIGSWNNNISNAFRPIFWGCALSDDKTYIVSFTKTATSVDNLNLNAMNTINAPYRKGYTFGGWATSAANAAMGISAYTAANVDSATNGTVLYAIWF